MRGRWVQWLLILAVLILGGVVVAGIVWILLKIATILLLFLLAGILTFALMPLVDRLHGFGLPRPAAILVAYLSFAIFFGGLGYLVIPALVDQSSQLADRLPSMVHDLQDPNSALAEAIKKTGLNVDLTSLSSDFGSRVQAAGETLLGDVVGIARQISTALVDVVLILVIAFYLLNEGQNLRGRLDQLVPEEHHSKLIFVEETVDRVMGGYLRGQLLVALMVAILAGIGSGLVGLHYAMVVGALAGLFELIPFFGPVLSAIPALAIALFQGPLLRVLAILVIFIVIQQVESNIVGPRITGHAVGLHPLVVMFSILVGVEIGGIWGAIFAVPVAGVVVAVARKLYSINRESSRRIKPAA